MIPLRLIKMAIIILAVLYILSPIDFIPDIIPIIGWIDDIIVGLIAVTVFLKTGM